MDQKRHAVNAAPKLIDNCTTIRDLLSTFAPSTSEYAPSRSTAPSTSDPSSVILSQEIRQLSGVFESIRGSYGSDLYSDHSPAEAKFWSSIGNVIRDCQSNLQELEATLKIQVGEGKFRVSNLWGGVRTRTKFMQANSEITVYRHLAQSYREVLQLSLNVSNLAVQNARGERLQELKKRVNNLSAILQFRANSESVEANAKAKMTLKTLQVCVQAAAELLEDARTRWHMPIEIDGTVQLAELASTEARWRLSEPRTGCETPIERLSISTTSTKKTQATGEEPKVMGATMDVTSIVPGSPRRSVTSVPDTSSYDVYNDSDSDWEAAANENMGVIAQEKYEAGDYATAEGFLRKVVSTNYTNEKYPIMLAVCLIRANKITEAERVLARLERSPSQETVFRAQHYLGEMFVGTGQIEKAGEYAKKAMKGRGKLYGREDLRTAQSISLFAEVLALLKHPEKAASYARMLPGDFKREESDIAKCFERNQKRPIGEAVEQKANIVELKADSVEPKELPGGVEKKVKLTETKIKVPTVAKPEAPKHVALADKIGEIVDPISPDGREWLEEFDLRLSVDRLNIVGEARKIEGDRTAAHEACEKGDSQVLQLLIKNSMDMNTLDDKQDSPLLVAASHGQTACVHLLVDRGPFGGIKAGVDVNAKNAKGLHPLHFAASQGLDEMITYLVGSRSNVNVKDIGERTPLHYTAEHGRDTSALLLLEAGANINCKDRDNDTPLHFACLHNKVQVARLLIDRGADVNARNSSGVTPLMHAEAEVSEILLDAGANVDSTNDSNTSVLLDAVDRDLQKKVELLLKRGVDPSIAIKSNGFTPQHAAALHRRNEIARKLLECGADPNVCDNDGRTPLFHARAQVAEMLIKAGADVEIKDKQDSRALHFAVIRDESELVKLLLKEKAEVDSIDSLGCTPLMLSVQYGHKDCFLPLLEAGANIGIRDNQGRPPLHYIEKKSAGLASILLEKGADIDSKDDLNSTALHHAVWKDDTAAVMTLLHFGAKHSVNNDGFTPLHGCAIHNYNKSLVMLLNKRSEGFDLEARDSRGRTPLHLAAIHDALKTAPPLIEAGADVCAKDSDGRAPSSYCKSVKMAKLLMKALDDVDNDGNTALHHAVFQGHADVAAFLIEKNVLQAKRNKDGLPALMVVVKEHQINVLKVMLQKKVDLEVTDKNGRTPLLEAVEHGHAEMAQLLAKAGANVDAVAPGGRKISEIALEKGVSL